MSYNSSQTPAAGNTLSVDQGNMLNNFMYLFSSLGTQVSATKDHQISASGNNTNSFEGRHLRCSLFNQASNLAHPGDGVDTMLYSSGHDLWARNPSDPQLQITNLHFSAKNSAFAPGATCYSFLPGALCIQFGFISPSTNQTATAVTFSGLGGKAFPNACFGVWTAPQRASSNVDVVYTSSISSTGFTYYNTSSSGITAFSWLALGN